MTKKNSLKLSFRLRIWRRVAAILVPAALTIAAVPLSQAATDVRSAASLRARYVALGNALKDNQFNRPLLVESTESSSRLQGEVYALVDYPIAEVVASLSKPGNWCDVLILHLNTKHCRATQDKTTPMLSVSIGKKHDQPIEDAYRVDFVFNAAQSTPGYLDVRLHADKGPLGTKDYRIAFEATSVADGKTFLHLTYSYGYSFASRVAMQGYLATVGSNKVGFTKAPAAEQGGYIGGVRGLVERNTMRYYLAINSYLDARDAPQPEQLEKRLQGWYAATERYSRQLYEIDRISYLTMKRSEVLRQQTSQQ